MPEWRCADSDFYAIEQALIDEFDWDKSDNAIGYRLQISREPAFSVLEFDTAGLTEDRFTLTQELEHKTQYFWRVTSTNECGLTFSPAYKFTTKFSVSTFDPYLTSAIKLFPNPAKDIVEIEIDIHEFSFDRYRIHSLNGRLLASGEITGLSTTVDISHFTPGIYTVQILKDNQLVTKKLIIF